MHKSEFSLALAKSEFLPLITNVDKKLLAVWAIECAKRGLPLFEKEKPADKRPQIALKTLSEWIKTGNFNMNVIRMASLNSHAAARSLKTDSPARSVARACGQAVATAHVKTHAIGAAIYAQQSIFQKTNSIKDVRQEKDWQLKKLLELAGN